MRHIVVLLVSALVVFGIGTAWCEGAGLGKPDQEGIGRFLLVASEGLYIVESDGRCSWSFTVPPLNGQSPGEFDHLIYDGWALTNGNILFGTHRYVREIDRQKRTVWEYRVTGKNKVKTCVPLPNGRVAVLNSQDQAILELESGTGQVLHRIPVPAEGTLHTRYNLLRRTPEGNYLVALRAEERFVEVDSTGKVLRSLPVPSLPALAQTLSDGTTLCSGRFGLIRFDANGKKTWSFTPEDAAPHFPLLIAVGTVELPDGRLLVVNSDWHYQKPGENRVQLFITDFSKNISWTLPVTAFEGWKRGEIEPKTGLLEHRAGVVQLLGPDIP